MWLNAFSAGIEGLDAGEKGAADLDGRQAAGRDVVADGAGRALEQSADDARHAEEAGPGAASGALASASATGSDSRGSSSRSRLSRACTCAVAGTPLVSIAWTCSA